MSETRYPEHDKLEAVQAATQAAGELLEWLPTEGFEIARWDSNGKLVPAYLRTEDLLARWVGIDPEAYRAEKERKYQEVASRAHQQ